MTASGWGAQDKIAKAGDSATGTIVFDGTPPIQIPAGAAAGDVLTSDASGNASWQADAAAAAVAEETSRATTAEAALAAVLAAMSVLDWVNVMTYGAEVNGTTDDTAAVQAAITANPGGTLYVPAGTGSCMILSGPLTGMGNNFRMTGQIGATLKTSANGLFSLGTASIRNMEIDHLTLDVTGGDVFNGSSGNLGRSYFHDLNITQRSAGYAIWNAPSIAVYIENWWERISSTTTTSARTVPAWNFVSSSNDLFNENVFEKIVCNNNGPDTAKYHFFVDCNGSGSTYQNNTFRNLTFENPLGGCIKVLSAQQTTLQNCHVWDLSANPSAHLFYVGTDATSAVPSRSTAIRDCGRVYGAMGTGGPYDIHLDSGTLNTVIDNYYLQATGVEVPVFDLGSGALGTTIINPPAGLVLENTTGATYSFVGGSVTNAAPVSFLPASPTATASSSYVMMGLGTTCAFKPTGSGIVLVNITGQAQTATAVANMNIAPKYGTGTAPANGVAVTGTTFGCSSNLLLKAPFSAIPTQFSFTAVLNLTAGTTYWFDLALLTQTPADVASLSNVGMSFVELAL